MSLTGALTRVPLAPALWGLDGGFSPTNYPALAGWYRADSGIYLDTARTSPATADGALIRGWSDGGPAAAHASQGGAANVPGVLKLNIQNGRPAVRFDGIRQFLSAPVVVAGAGLSFYLVTVPRALVLNDGISLVKSGQTNDHDNAGSAILLYHNATNGLSTFHNGLKSVAANGVVGTACIFSSIFDGANSIAYKNGSAGTTVADTGVFDSATLYLPCRWAAGIVDNFAQLDVCEAIIYGAAHSAAQRAAVWGYLNSPARWAVY